MGGDSRKLIVIDVDETETRALLFNRKDGEYSLEANGDSATTENPPDLDVTIGVKNVVKILENKTGEALWSDDSPEFRLLCSSGDSGGLYMAVAGVMGAISGESAERATLGAGAHLLDIFTKDDKRPEYAIIERLRSMRPDVFLIAGGTDGGAFSQVLDMVHLIKWADVKPRFGGSYKLPVIYAGNIEAREEVAETLSQERYAVKAVENVRPIIERENLGPAKEAIFDSYMEHVIVHSPGYDKLSKWVDGKIIPSQAAIGKAIYAYAEEKNLNLLAVDIGGATTDVYSVYNGIFNRSLNAEVGLSYGILNLVKLVGVESLSRWLPMDLSERGFRNIVANLMVKQTKKLTEEEEAVRSACAREAIRLSVNEHKRIASRLKGVKVTRTIADTFIQTLEDTYLKIEKTQAIVVRGKALEQSKSEAANIILDSLEPVGVTEILVDDEKLLPHAGVLLDTSRKSALSLLDRRVLKLLATCIAPSGVSDATDALTLTMKLKDSTKSLKIPNRNITVIKVAPDEKLEATLTPESKLDLGRGKGKIIERTIRGGVIGVIFDTRGRPLRHPIKKDSLRQWVNTLTAGGGIP